MIFTTTWQLKREQKLITRGCRGVGILDSIELELSALSSIKAFDDIVPLLSKQLEDICENVDVIDEKIDIDNNLVDEGN